MDSPRDGGESSSSSARPALQPLITDAGRAAKQLITRWGAVHGAAVADWVALLGALVLYLRVIMGPAFFSTTRYVGVPGDINYIQWYIGWIWYALTHHQALLVTPSLGAPSGTNLMSAQTAPALGLLFGWLYPLIGVAAATNLMFIVNYALILIFGKLTLKQLGVSRWLASLGVCLFLLLPFLFPQENGHLSLYFVGFQFAVGYWLVRLFTTARRPTPLEGAALGACVAANFYVSQETELTLVLFAAVVLVWALLFAPQATWAKVRRLLYPGYVVAALLPLVVVLPGLLNFFQSVGGKQFVPPEYSFTFVNDLLSFVVPTDYFFVHDGGTSLVAKMWTGIGVEISGYLSMAALLLLAVAAARTWDRKGTRILLGSIATMMVFSLGRTLHVAGVVTRWSLPWKLLAQLPLVGNALEARFGLYFQYAAVLLLILAAQRYFEDDRRTQRGWRLGAATAANVGSLLVVVALWFPAAPLPTSDFPAAARILATPAVSARYFQGKSVLFLRNNWDFPDVLGMLADSGIYSVRTPNNYGTLLAVLAYPPVDLGQYQATLDADPRLYAAHLQAVLPALHVQEVAYVSPIWLSGFDEAIAPSLLRAVDGALGPPAYNNRGRVVVWEVPAVVGSDQLTAAADFLYRALGAYVQRAPNQPITMPNLVRAGVLPATFLTSDPNWTAFGGWVGDWSSHQVAIGVPANGRAAQAIVRKYAGRAQAIYYPYGTRVTTDASGNAILGGASTAPEQTLFLTFAAADLLAAGSGAAPAGP